MESRNRLEALEDSQQIPPKCESVADLFPNTGIARVDASGISLYFTGCLCPRQASGEQSADKHELGCEGRLPL